MRDVVNLGGVEVAFVESGETTGGALDMFEMTVFPSARMPVPHYHDRWEETIYGLSGSLIFRIGGQDVTIGPGDTAFIPRGTVHGFRNDSSEPAKCLCVLTPGVLGPGYFRELAAALCTMPPDMAVIRGIMGRYGLVPAPEG